MAVTLERQIGDGWLVTTAYRGRLATAWLSKNRVATFTGKAEQRARADMDATISSWMTRLWVRCLPHRRAAYLAEVDARATELLPLLIEQHIHDVIACPEFLYRRTWHELRPLIIQRDGKVCQEPRCRRAIELDIDLHIDHIKPRSVFPELSLDPANLRVLCRECNFRKAARFTPQGQDKFDWDATVISNVSAGKSCGVSSTYDLRGVSERGGYHREKCRSVGVWEDRMVREFGESVITLLPDVWHTLERK